MARAIGPSACMPSAPARGAVRASQGLRLAPAAKASKSDGRMPSTAAMTAILPRPPTATGRPARSSMTALSTASRASSSIRDAKTLPSSINATNPRGV